MTNQNGVKRGKGKGKRGMLSSAREAREGTEGERCKWEEEKGNKGARLAVMGQGEMRREKGTIEMEGKGK